jgi:predicted AAA+ superfamily ATPase
LLKLRAEDLIFSPFKGHLFESLMISNFVKHHFNYRSAHEFYFWRDHKGIEIDLLIESHAKLIAVELKSGTTITQHYFDHLKKYREYAGEDIKKSFLIYGGSEQSQRSNINILPWADATEEALKQ